MTKQEREALIELYRNAVRVKEGSSFQFPEHTHGFNQGYAWGVECALEAVGFTDAERYELWSPIYDEIVKDRISRKKAAERQS